MVHAGFERFVHGEAHHALGGLHGQRRVLGDLFGQSVAEGHQVVVVNDVVDEAGFQRFLRAQGLTPAQVWGLTASQTGFMGLVAGVLALPVGTVLALVLIFVINRRSFGWTLVLAVSLP